MTTLNYKEKEDLIRHITLGTNEVFYYAYNDGREPLPLRSLTSYELDQCFYKALEDAPTKVASFVIKSKLQLFDKNKKIEVDSKNYVEIQRFYNEIDYWIVYYAMKNFQSDEFTKPNYDELEGYPNGFYITHQMEEIHNIALMVLNHSTQPKEVIKEVFYDDMGKQLAMKITYLNQPLAKINKLTKIQEDFLIYSQGHLREVIRGEAKKDAILRSDTPVKVKDILRMI